MSQKDNFCCDTPAEMMAKAAEMVRPLDAKLAEFLLRYASNPNRCPQCHLTYTDSQDLLEALKLAEKSMRRQRAGSNAPFDPPALKAVRAVIAKAKATA